MNITPQLVEQVRAAVRRDRLLDTAIALVEVPSPTRSAGAVADRLAAILSDAGLPVERPVAGWPDAPAVAARLTTGRPGRVLQFNGHLDTVHLPFVPPRVSDGILYGSGASDMKGGIAAMVEAARALGDTGLLPGGGILITAHDMHESPWGDGKQVDRLIDEGFLGDGVLLPEYVYDRVPVAGRGLAIMEIDITRLGEPTHEVLGGIDGPSVIAAGAELVRRFGEWDRQVANRTHPLAGRESVFVGLAAGGEIYNQSPTHYQIKGTRRWLAGTRFDDIEREYRGILDGVARETDTTIDGRLVFCRDAFELDLGHPLVSAFQSAHAAVTGTALPIGAKPFVDDGNTFIAHGRVPAITHGPNAKGAHTVHEAAPIDELVRVAVVYALTAIAFCGEK
jgi:acetylornithine deacetylase/succinyl-diaminopimelate desuccinylase-like protein